MKTKEFIRKVEDLGYRVVENDDVISIHYLGENIGNVFKNKECKNPILLDLMVEYTNTPIEEREEPKKYYLRHRWLKNKCKEQYLNIDRIYDSYFLVGNANTELYKTQFTEKEIEELKDKLDTDLADFEEVEVEE